MPRGITGAQLIFSEGQSRFSEIEVDDKNIRMVVTGTAQLKESGDHSFYIRPDCTIVFPKTWLRMLLAKLARAQYEARGHKGVVEPGGGGERDQT